MGKVKPNVLGVFSGKIGNMVYATWKGIPYVRSKPVSINNPRTEAQQSHRAKFALGIRFLKPCTNFIRVGYQKYAIKKSASNAALSYILANAITGSYPDYRIDYPRVLLSRGSLMPPVNVQASIVDGTVLISWDNNSRSNGCANATDKALAIVINPDNGEVAYKIAGAPRASCIEMLDLPTCRTGDQVVVYLGFISDDDKEVSDSVYAGSITV